MKKLWPSEVRGQQSEKWQLCPTRAAAHHSMLLHFGCISELKGFGIWIYLFQEDMFSYKSSIPKNLNHSIRMRDDQVMDKTKAWVLEKF